jgi:hypothetical protein
MHLGAMEAPDQGLHRSGFASTSSRSWFGAPRGMFLMTLLTDTQGGRIWSPLLGSACVKGGNSGRTSPGLRFLSARFISSKDLVLLTKKRL